jgi:uncharacterized YkwD family protein
MVTGLLLFAVALLPAAPAMAMTVSSDNGNDADQEWKKTFEILVKHLCEPTMYHTSFALYTFQLGKSLIFSPVQPPQAEQPPATQTPEPPAGPQKPAEPAKPATPAEPAQPEKPAQPVKPEAPAQPPAAKPELPVKPPMEQPPAQPEKPAQPVGNGGNGTSAPAPAGLTADEQLMVQLVNQERQNAGLQPLEVDMALVKVARVKAQDMIDRGYFSHTSPTYGSPFDMMRSFGITDWRAAAENIAQNPSVTGAHESFMNSPGHRNNIMNPAFNKVGIGILDGGPYGKTFVQLFTQTD